MPRAGRREGEAPIQLVLVDEAVRAVVGQRGLQRARVGIDRRVERDVGALERAVAARRGRPKTDGVPDYTCPKCGFENPLPVKFCGECGVKLTS